MVRRAALFCLGACSFTHGAPAASSDAHGTDGTKVFLDSPVAMDAGADSAVPVGSIAVTPTSLTATNLDLSTEGTTDWAHWGYMDVNGFDRKTGGSALSDATVQGGGGAAQVVGSAVTASWTGGTPDQNVTTTTSGVAISHPDGLKFTVAAGKAPHTLRLYISGHSARGKLVLALSDSSAASYTNNQFQGSGDWYGLYTIVFHSASDGQTLSVEWDDDGDLTGSAWVTLLDATDQ